MKASFQGLAVDSCIGVVPANVSRFDDEIANYSHDPQSSLKLKEVMGYGEHRIALPGTTTSDLALKGLCQLLDIGALKAEEVDALYFVSQSPDYQMPPTSCVLHGALGLPNTAYCVDINDGCNGFIRGLFEAGAFLSATQGQCAVIVAGDVLSPKVSPRDRNSYPLIGDAATVTVLRRRANAPAFMLEICHDGAGHSKLMIPAGGARKPSSSATAQLQADDEGNWRSEEHLRMLGRDVFAFTQTVVPRFIEAFAKERGMAYGGYDRMFLHQANAFIIDRLRKKFGVDERVMPDRVVRHYGNSSSGTVPMLLASEPAGAAPLRCLLAGFGVGLSWGAADLVLAPGVAKGILEF